MIRLGSDRARRGAGLALLVWLAACVPAPKAPPPAPAPLPAPAPVPSPAPAMPAQAWDVAPLTPGDWSYQREGTDGVASFGLAGAAPLVALRCDRARREMVMSLAGVTQAGSVVLRTSAGTLNWPGTVSATGGASLAIVRPARDSGLDWIAFSRGRVAIEAPGHPRLILPVWAEVSRVIEDCRD